MVGGGRCEDATEESGGYDEDTGGEEYANDELSAEGDLDFPLQVFGVSIVY